MIKNYPTERKIPNKMWYPEMIEFLKKEWSSELNWKSNILLAKQLSDILFKIVSENNIHAAKFQCNNCGSISNSDELSGSKITVSAMIYSLCRFGIINEQIQKELLKNWKKYKIENSIEN